MQKKQDCPLCGNPSILLREITKRPTFYGFCPTCKGIFIEHDSLLSPSEELAQYETHNNDVEDPRYQNFVSPLVELVASKQQTKDRGLDFGAGPGPVTTKLLEDRGYQLNLYDPYFYPDKSALQSPYDFIVCCEVIEHFYEPYQSFTQLSNLLAEGGRLYCRTSLIPDDIEFSRWHYKNESTHVFFYHRETITWIAENILKSDVSIIDKNLLYFSR